MPHEEPATHMTPAQDTAVDARATPAYEPPPYEEIDDSPHEWLEEPEEEIPRRPRRRLLGVGGNPLALAFIGVLLCACGFIGGVLVEKGQGSSGSSSSSSASLASRFRALRGGTTAASTGGSSGSSSGFARPTAGTVAYLEGSTLYVTNAEGNTVKVTTSPGTSVTKSVKSSVPGIHPGETVTITGATGSNGAVSAESISVGATGGGFAGLFGGTGGAGASGNSSAGSGGGKEPALFGNGG